MHNTSTKKELKIRELKSETPTEHAETEFHVDDVFAKTFLSLEAIHTKEPILIREIDHACSSKHCISHQVVAMLRLAHRKVFADVNNDQPLDA